MPRSARWLNLFAQHYGRLTLCFTFVCSLQASADATQQQVADLQVQLATEQQAGGELGSQLSSANAHVSA